MQVAGESCVIPSGQLPEPPPSPSSAPPPSSPSAQPQPQPLPPYEPVVPGPHPYVPVVPAPRPNQAAPPPDQTIPPSTYTPVPPTPLPAPPPVASHPVPIHFVARAGDGDRYRIKAEGHSCTTPCTLELTPGNTRVDADSGHATYGAGLPVPELPATVAVSHRSRAQYAVGGALLAVGLTSVALGSWFTAGNGFDGHDALGGVTIGIGAVAAIVGIVDLALAGRARLDMHVDAGSATERSAR